LIFETVRGTSQRDEGKDCDCLELVDREPSCS